MEVFNLPIIAEKYNQNLLTLSNIQKIELAEYYLLNYAGGSTELDWPLTHIVCNNVYIRQITLPKGALLTGKVHNYDHTSIISKGDVSVLTNEGMTRIKASSTWSSKAGTKRLIYVHEETIWATIHKTKYTKIADIEDELVHQSNLSWIDESIKLGVIQ